MLGCYVVIMYKDLLLKECTGKFVFQVIEVHSYYLLMHGINED